MAMAGMALMTLWLVYMLLRHHGPSDLALPLTLVIGLNYEMFLFSHQLLTEIPFMLLLMIGLLCYARGLMKGGA